MAKKRRRKKSIWKSTFYRVYFALVVLGVIGIIIGTNWLNGVLADYEATQPVYAAEEAARMFKDADFETIYDYDTSAAEIAEGDREFYVESLREIAQGKEVTWASSYASTEDEKIYNVMLSGEKFAEISLVPSGEVTSHGNRYWTLDSVTTFVTLGEQQPVEEEVEEEPEEVVEEVPAGTAYHITAPTDSKVLADGVELTEENAVGTIPTVADGMLPAGIPIPTFTEYVVYSESGAPQFTVTDEYGNPQEPAESGENAWSCPLPETPGLKETFQDAAINVAQQLARLSAKTISKDSMLQYCAKNSPARYNVENFDNSTGKNKKPERFENIASSSYYQYDENSFSCHVSFDYISKFTAQVIKTYPTSYTLYFIVEGGSGKLYSFTLY